MADLAAIANISKNLRQIADGDLTDEYGEVPGITLLTSDGVHASAPLDEVFRQAANALDRALAETSANGGPTDG